MSSFRRTTRNRTSTTEVDITPQRASYQPQPQSLPIDVFADREPIFPGHLQQQTEPQPDHFSSHGACTLLWDHTRPPCSWLENPSSIDVHWLPTTKTAFIRLNFSITLQDKKNPTSIYIHIPPERISRLTVYHAVKGIDCKHTRTLIFDIAKPLDVILPRERAEMGTVLDEYGRHLLDDVYSLACQTHFTCHATVLEKHFPFTRLVELSQGISLKELSIYDEVTSVQTLYGGKGGYVVKGKDLSTSRGTHYTLENILDPEYQPRLPRLPHVEVSTPLQPPSLRDVESTPVQPRLQRSEQRPPVEESPLQRLQHVEQSNSPSGTKRRRSLSAAQLEDDDLEATSSQSGPPVSGGELGLEPGLIAYLDDMKKYIVSETVSQTVERTNKHAERYIHQIMAETAGTEKKPKHFR